MEKLQLEDFLTPEQIDLAEFTEGQLSGKQQTTLSKRENVRFLVQCVRQKRGCADMLRVIVEDYTRRMDQQALIAAMEQQERSGSSNVQRFHPTHEEFPEQASGPSKGQAR